MLNLDTHILLFAFSGNLKSAERRLLSTGGWSISAIVLWEIAKLSQLGRIEMDVNDPDVVRKLARVKVWPISLEICQALFKLDFKGDPADELIAATSLVHNLPLVTRDQTLRSSRIVPLANRL